MSRVISFSLYGDDPKYTLNAIINCALAPAVYPGWRCRFYVDDTVPDGVLQLLDSFPHVELVAMPRHRGNEGMLWRFLAAGDQTVDVMISRDADSWLSSREAACVEAWLAGDRPFHAIRDHCAHSVPVLGGLWGARRGVLADVEARMEPFVRRGAEGEHAPDQRFLAEEVYPRLTGRMLVHSGDEGRRSFSDGGEPIPRHDVVDEPVAGLSLAEAHAINAGPCGKCGTVHDAFVGSPFGRIPARATAVVRELARGHSVLATALPGLGPDPACPILCINLPSSVARRRRMERRLAHHGLLGRTRFVEAIAADSPLIDERLAGLSDHQRDPIRRAEAAALASHLRAIRIFVEESPPTTEGAIIAEDDALLCNDWSERLPKVFANLPENAPLCWLFYTLNTWDGARWAGRDPGLENLCTFVPANAWQSVMYWISRPYAETVLERWDAPFRHLPPEFYAELILKWSGGYLAYPPLALEDAIDSDLRPDLPTDFHLPSLRGWGYENYSACEEGDELSPLASPAGAEDGPTVGLAIIARDEEDSLPALLATCDGAFDEVVLVDTGSRDKTVKRFQAWAKAQTSTRCSVDHFAWRDDFAAARQHADDLLTTDWKVWADCDDEIVGATRLRELAARAPADVAAYTFGYDIARDESGTCTMYSKRERLVRAGRGRWAGRLHEFQHIDGTVADAGPEVAEWVHHRDRKGGRPRPSRRDVDILTADLEANPDDPRTVFYLAQSHRDAGNVAEAIVQYERRAGMGGWEQEVFYSLLQAGLLRADRGEWITGMRLLLDSWAHAPSRAEPLYEMAWRHRAEGDYRNAYLVARQGMDLPQPADALFVQPWVYRWGLLFECSINAYWVGEQDEAESLCRRLLALPDLPEAYRTQTALNLDATRAAGVCWVDPPTVHGAGRRVP